MKEILPVNDSKRRGFTLIELLVVVSIIAVLIAILLPSLGKAREKAKQTNCLSNLKTLGLSTIMYQMDNNGGLPRGSVSPGSGIDWVFWEAGRNRNSAALVPYQGGSFNKKVYICPSDPLTRRGTGTYPFSYSANINIFRLCAVPAYPAPNSTGAVGAYPFFSPNSPIKFGSIRFPGTKILMIDEVDMALDDGGWAPNNYTVGQPYNVLSTRHFKGGENQTDINHGTGTANFADGHADVIRRPDAMLKRSYDPLMDG